MLDAAYECFDLEEFVQTATALIKKAGLTQDALGKKLCVSQVDTSKEENKVHFYPLLTDR